MECWLLSKCKSKPAGVWYYSWLVLYVMYFIEIGSNTSKFCICWAVWCPMTCVIVQCHAAEWHQLYYWSVPPGWTVSTFDSRSLRRVGALPPVTQVSGGKVVIQLLPKNWFRIPVRPLLSMSTRAHLNFFGGGAGGMGNGEINTDVHVFGWVHCVLLGWNYPLFPSFSTHF
jgi:hypothetical protein